MHERIETADIGSVDTAAILDGFILENEGPERAREDGLREDVLMCGFHESVLTRPDGSGVYQVKRNLITNAGFDFLAAVCGATSQPSRLSHIGIGTGATAAAATQTALTTQVARGSATYAHSANTKVFTMEHTFAAGTPSGTNALRETACFNAASGGTMFNRVTYEVVNKGPEDSLLQRFTYTFS